MNKLIRINNQELSIKELNAQRVITFKDIDMLHERVEGTAGRNFRENREHFIEELDYFFVKPSDIQTDEIRRSEINNAGTYLITESGYLMLVKSLTDDLAWKVQRELVNKYFRVKEATTDISQLSPETQLLLKLSQSIAKQELANKQIEHEVKQTKEEVQAIRDVIVLNPKAAWRRECNRILNAIGMKLNNFRLPKEEVYEALKERGNCRPNVLVNNLKKRARANGMTPSKVEKLNILDVLENEPRLKEIYVTIVKEMAIKNSVQV